MSERGAKKRRGVWRKRRPRKIVDEILFGSGMVDGLTAVQLYNSFGVSQPILKERLAGRLVGPMRDKFLGRSAHDQIETFARDMLAMCRHRVTLAEASRFLCSNMYFHAPKKETWSFLFVLEPVPDDESVLDVAEGAYRRFHDSRMDRHEELFFRCLLYRNPAAASRFDEHRSMIRAGQNDRGDSPSYDFGIVEELLQALCFEVDPLAATHLRLASESWELLYFLKNSGLIEPGVFRMIQEARMEKARNATNSECAICFETGSCLFLPCCGKTEICKGCAQRHGLESCPFCRSKKAKLALESTPRDIVLQVMDAMKNQEM